MEVVLHTALPTRELRSTLGSFRVQRIWQAARVAADAPGRLFELNVVPRLRIQNMLLDSNIETEIKLILLQVCGSQEWERVGPIGPETFGHKWAHDTATKYHKAKVVLLGL